MARRIPNFVKYELSFTPLTTIFTLSLAIKSKQKRKSKAGTFVQDVSVGVLSLEQQLILDCIPWITSINHKGRIPHMAFLLQMLENVAKVCNRNRFREKKKKRKLDYHQLSWLHLTWTTRMKPQAGISNRKQGETTAFIYEQHSCFLLIKKVL